MKAACALKKKKLGGVASMPHRGGVKAAASKLGAVAYGGHKRLNARRGEGRWPLYRALSEEAARRRKHSKRARVKAYRRMHNRPRARPLRSKKKALRRLNI